MTIADGPREHIRVLVYFDATRVSTPAEVCWACSDEPTGLWRPIGDCPITAAQARRDPDALVPAYTAESAYDETALADAGHTPDQIAQMRAHLTAKDTA